MKKALSLLLSAVLLLINVTLVSAQPQSELTKEEVGLVAIMHAKHGKNFFVNYDNETNTLQLLSKEPVSDEIKKNIKILNNELSQNLTDEYTLKLFNLSDTGTVVGEYAIKPVKNNAQANQGNNQLTYETNNAKYVIKNTYVTDNSMFPDKKVVVIEMTFTNKQNRPASPWTTFVRDYTAQQTDGTTTVELMGANGQMGNVENQEAVAMGDTNVNSGATVDAIIGYDYSNPTAPVGFILRTSQFLGELKGFNYTPAQ